MAALVVGQESTRWIRSVETNLEFA